MSHLRRHQSSHSITNGFTPGGHIPVGYSYLDRAHSLVTPTRRNVPRGMESPRTDSFDLSTPSPQLSKSSSAQLQHSESFSDLSTYNKRTSDPQQFSTASRRSSLESLRDSPYRNDTSIAPENVAELIEQLPKDPLRWLPSHVAVYLTYVLGLTPKPIVQDVTAYVRNAGMSGRSFLRLKEKDLAAEGLNLKWRKLMIEAVKKLRKDCLRGHLWSLEGSHAYTDAEEQEQQPDIPKQVNANSTGTLKRLRDKKAVRDMISSFENIREGSSDGEDAFVALGGLQKRGSVSSLHSISSSQSNDSLNRPAIPPIYGEGYVRERAESFSSLREQAHIQHTSRPAFTREQLQDWFGDLSESEVQGLADELDAEDELSHGHAFNRSVSESSINSESCSSESMPTTPPAAEVIGFNLTPIDANLVKSIVESPTLEQGSNDLIVEAHLSTSNYIQPLHKDILVDEDQDDLLAGPRPGAANGGKTNPYRRSTYEEEELEALGLDANVNTCKFDTAKKVPRIAEERGADQDSVRIKRSGDENAATGIRDIFATHSEESNNVHHHASRDSSADDEVPPLKTARTVGTFGRAALMSALQQATEAQNDSSKRAEDESEWGVTFSRKASRRNTLARADGANAAAAVHADHAKEITGTSAASRMSQLFNPIPLSEANLEKHEKDAEASPTDETSTSPQDKILLPLTTLEPDNEGKGSIKKHSMVLVDRRKFEALAKRMGVLEDQLAGLEAISLPPDSDLGSLGKSSNMNAAQVRAALDEVFTIPAVPSFHHVEDDEHEEILPADEEEKDPATSKWSLLRQFGIIPSYSEYLYRDFLGEKGSFFRECSGREGKLLD